MDTQDLETTSLSVDEINGLISEAFGKGFSGDNFEHAGDMTEGILSRTGNLGVIGHHGFGQSQQFNRVAGYFGKNEEGQRNGSILVVKPKYSKQAIKYAQAYERETGRRVSIRLAS